MPLPLALRLAPLLLAGAISPLLAAPAPLPPPGSLVVAPSPLVDAPALDDLLTLPGERVNVRYPPGALDRAARVQIHLEAFHKLWQGFLPQPLAWSAVLLTREQWEGAGLGPYGAVVRPGPGEFLLPSEGDAGTVAFVRALTGGTIPDPGVDPMLGTREEAGSLIVSDLLLELEAARDFVAAAPLTGDVPWASGVLLQLVLRYTWDRLEPTQTLLYVALFDAIAAVNGGPRARRLADYQEGLPFEVELWYQAQFVRGADAIWIETSWMGVSRRFDKWRRKAVPVTAAELEKRYPGILAWKRDAFAP